MIGMITSRVCCLTLLALCSFTPAFCQSANRPGSEVPILPGYKYVEWPTEAKSEAGFPAGLWNFIQVPAVAVAPNGHILLLHRGAHPLLEFESSGNYLTSWDVAAFSEGKVVAIPVANRSSSRSNYSAVYGPAGCDSCGVHSVRVDPQGNIWLVDAPGDVVYKFNQRREMLLRLGEKGVSGKDTNHFYLPTDVGFAPNGDFYVTDGYGNARVMKYTHDGKFLLQFGSRGTGPGQFGLPHNVVVDAQGRVYVTDRDNQRVEVFDSNGKFLKQWKTYGGVSTLIMTKDQHIWAGGFLHDLDGKPLGRLPFPKGAVGGGHGAAITDSGDIYIAELSGVVEKFVRAQ
jgi:streptogramin lyase